jgi:NAD(P)-dependent dehydrogenase (short-subunit alcohol dehydrogenase family)
VLSSAVADRALEGQVALVTGAGRGIGRAVAVALAGQGARVALLGRTRETLEDAAVACADAGGPSTVVTPADVTDRAEVAAAVATVEGELGPVDLLVANAGLRESADVPPWEVDPDEWWRVQETNVRGVFLLDHAVLPGMVERGRGRVLHVGSGMGHQPRDDGGWSAYAVSKTALARLTDSLANALAGSGVTVLEASPGLVRTDMTEAMWGPADEQSWSPVEAMASLAIRFARGDLDALHGRFVHAARDDVDALVARAGEVAADDSRTLRLRPFGPDDPLA